MPTIESYYGGQTTPTPQALDFTPGELLGSVSGELGLRRFLEARGHRLIVTADKDFTTDDLAPWNVEAKHPDDFVLDQIDINDRMIWGCVQQIAISRKGRPETIEDVLAQLERSGLVRSAAALRRS